MRTFADFEVNQSNTSGVISLTVLNVKIDENNSNYLIFDLSDESGITKTVRCFNLINLKPRFNVDSEKMAIKELYSCLGGLPVKMKLKYIKKSIKTFLTSFQ